MSRCLDDLGFQAEKIGVKVKPKLRDQDEAVPLSHTEKNIALRENFALSTHYVKTF